MGYSRHIRRLLSPPGAAEPLSEADAHELFGAMLDGGVEDLELGALLSALAARARTTGELCGFHRATAERAHALPPPPSPMRPLVVPAFGGSRHQHNLLALVTLLLARMGVPVLLHGPLDAGGRTGAVYVLRELGVMPVATVAQARQALEERMIAFVPTAALCPGLANLLALQPRLGVTAGITLVASLVDPFAGEGVRVVSGDGPAELGVLGAFLADAPGSALLLQGTAGDPFVDPCRRPRIELFRDGAGTVLFPAEAGPVQPVGGLPVSTDAAATARWIRQALAGEAPIPHPLVNQVACCLYACGYTEDMNQAKAIAAVETSSLSPQRPARLAGIGVPET